LLALKNQKGSTVLRSFHLIALIIIINLPTLTFAAGDKKTLQYVDCPLTFADGVFDEAKGNCDVISYGNSGTKNVFLIRHNSDYVVFSTMLKGGPGRFFPFNRGLSATQKQLSIWNYIKKNWSDIKAFEPRTAYTADDKKVVLYRVNLQKERGCVAFVMPFGASSNSLAGANGDGHQIILSMLACPKNQSVTEAELVGIVSKFKVARKNF